MSGAYAGPAITVGYNIEYLLTVARSIGTERHPTANTATAAYACNFEIDGTINMLPFTSEPRPGFGWLVPQLSHSHAIYYRTTGVYVL